MAIESFFAATSDEEDWCERAWLEWRASRGLEQLTLLECPVSGPDRLYVTANHLVFAVEMTRLLEQDQREAVGFAEGFLRTRVLPHTQESIPGSFGVGIRPPWRVAKNRAAHLAERLIDWIVRSAATMRPGRSSNLAFDDRDGRVDITLYALSGKEPRVGWGHLHEGGGWVDDDYFAVKLVEAIRAKLARGQLSRVSAEQRVLLVHDRLLISDGAVGAAAALLTADEMSEVNEVILVRTWEGTSCVKVWPRGTAT
jgi:hypothetical protein